MSTGTVKYTPWFSCAEKPVRVGFYDALYVGDTKCDTRRYFNGAYWTGGPESSTQLCFGAKGVGDKWRGLAADPTGGAK